MIESYSIKFERALGNKEFEKLLNDDSANPEDVKKLSQVKAKIELLGSFDDLKRIRALIGELAGEGTS